MVPIIIVNWNGINDTLECVHSILNSEFNDFIIYLIDNNSDNSEYEQLQAHFSDESRILIKPYKKNYGFTGAHLKIWEEDLMQLDYEYLILLNNDTTVTMDCIGNWINFAKTQKTDICSAKMINYYDRSEMDNAGHKILTTGEIIPIGHQEGVNNFLSTSENGGACGGAALYRKDFIREAGFFDPHFETGYEDAELGLRALRMGYKINYCPDAVVFHKGGQAIKKVFDESYAVKNQKNILYSKYKNFPFILLLLYSPIAFIKTILILLLSIISFKWNYARIIIKSQFQFLTSDLKKALIQRKATYNNIETLPTWTFYKKLKSFILFDLKRVFNFLIIRKPSALDQYR